MDDNGYQISAKLPEEFWVITRETHKNSHKNDADRNAAAISTLSSDLTMRWHLVMP